MDEMSPELAEAVKLIQELREARFGPTASVNAIRKADEAQVAFLARLSAVPGSHSDRIESLRA